MADHVGPSGVGLLCEPGDNSQNAHAQVHQLHAAIRPQVTRSNLQTNHNTSLDAAELTGTEVNSNARGLSSSPIALPSSIFISESQRPRTTMPVHTMCLAHELPSIHSAAASLMCSVVSSIQHILSLPPVTFSAKTFSVTTLHDSGEVGSFMAWIYHKELR